MHPDLRFAFNSPAAAPSIGTHSAKKPSQERISVCLGQPQPQNPAFSDGRLQIILSQDRFAKLLGISAAKVRDWELGRPQPTGAAKVLLRVAVKNPKAVLAAAA